MPTLRAAVVQAYTPKDLAHGLEIARERVREAVAQGATLVAFPETWLPGYPVWLDVCRDAAIWDYAPVKAVFRRLAEQSVAVPSDATRTLGGIAHEFSVTLVMGISERVEQGAGQGTLFNAILIFGPDGSLLNHHRKLMPTYTERMVWGPGDADGLRAVPAGDAQLGALVCWEHWMPLARQAMHDAGEDVHVALWPTVKEMNQVASRHYAFEGRCYVLAAGSLMQARDLPSELEPHPGIISDAAQFVLGGGSAIIGPDGAYLAGPVFNEETIVVADLDLGRIREERMNLDVSGHYSRRDVLGLTITRSNRLANGH